VSLAGWQALIIMIIIIIIIRLDRCLWQARDKLAGF
jgi:hypothetical protein